MSRTSPRATIARLSPRQRAARVAASSPPLDWSYTMYTRLITTTSLSALALLTLCAADVASAADRALSLTQEPLVMRLSKDEFRIAFGINAEQGANSGCNGVIHYRVDWKTEDGTTRSESKLVSYTVS